MTDTAERPSGEHRVARLGLRVAALGLDGWITLAAGLLWEWSFDERGTIQPWVEPWLLEYVLVMYFVVMMVLAFRFVIGLIFGTTPGRRLTGLKVVSDIDGGPVSRGRLALREFLVLLFFAIPLVNMVWIVRIFLDPERPGPHEWISETAVVRTS